MHALRQVDVFTSVLTGGNPVAVVHRADDLSTAQMASFANWTNLSATTFLLAPTDPAADYRLRIFTTTRELPFAGHPTLGSARAWLDDGGSPKTVGVIVQECGSALVRVRQEGSRLAFAAPALNRGGPVDPEDVAAVARALRVSPHDVVDAQWCQNGPEWVALRLRDAAAVLAVEPDFDAFGHHPDIGVVGLHRLGAQAQLEVRAFVAEDRTEDPVTGSLNAAVAQWLIPSGVLPASYVAAQGTVLGRSGRVHVDFDGADFWVGGDAVVGVTGSVAL
ncbi:MAG: PhzF family phenazine biosynthesis protein [Ornithinibacter sp.]